MRPRRRFETDVELCRDSTELTRSGLEFCVNALRLSVSSTCHGHLVRTWSASSPGSDKCRRRPGSSPRVREGPRAVSRLLFIRRRVTQRIEVHLEIPWFHRSGLTPSCAWSEHMRRFVEQCLTPRRWLQANSRSSTWATTAIMASRI